MRAAAAAAVSLHFMASTNWKRMMYIISHFGSCKYYLVAVGGEGVLVVALAEVSRAEVTVSSTLARSVAKLLSNHQVLLHVVNGLQLYGALTAGREKCYLCVGFLDGAASLVVSVSIQLLNTQSRINWTEL